MDSFLILGSVLLVGLIAELIKQRLRISEMLILVLFGFLLKVILGLGPLDTYAPFIGHLALIIILFESGLGLNLKEVLHGLGKVLTITVVNFLLSVFASVLILHELWGISFYAALLLGVIGGGTSSASMISLIKSWSISKEDKNILLLESLLTDVLVVLGASTLMQWSTSIQLNALVSTLSISLVGAGLGALVWWILLPRIPREYVYTLTLALVFILFGLMEWAGGSGLLAIFILGLILANISKSVPLKIYTIHREITFFVKTFLFFYTGLIISIPPIHVILMVVGVLALALIFRKAVFDVFRINAPWWAAPRGLAAIALASMTTRPQIIMGLVILSTLISYIGMPQKKKKFYWEDA